MVDTSLPSSAAVNVMKQCAESVWTLQCMLKREAAVYSCQRVVASESSEDDYAVLRSSLVDVFEEVYARCQLQNSDSIAVAISYLDRFIIQNHTNGGSFVSLQLAAMACFYLSIKVCDEPKKVPAATLCAIFQESLGCDDDGYEDIVEDYKKELDVEHLQAMELEVLAALQWNLNPPTGMMFVRQILACLPSLFNNTPWTEQAMELSLAQLEVAQRYNSSTQFQASTLAVASLFSTVEKLPVDNRGPVYKFLLQIVRMTEPDQQHTVLKAHSIIKKLYITEDASPALVPQISKKHSNSHQAAVDPPAKRQKSLDEGASVSLPRSSLASAAII